MASYVEPLLSPKKQVVKRLVKAAADKVQATREAGCAAVEQERKVRLAWARKQAQVAHQLADLASGRANELGSFLLKELEPALVPRERVEEEREAIASARAAESEAAHEAAKAAAGEAARAAAEAAAAARSEALETARAKAAEDAGEEGLPEDWAPADGEIPDEVDIEAAVAKAIDSVKVEEQAEVNDDDVLMSLLDKGELSKDVIMKAMAVDELGAAAWASGLQQGKRPARRRVACGRIKALRYSLEEAVGSGLHEADAVAAKCTNIKQTQ
eukprot:366190-Chlamydomonas_euryale.AAC.12